MYETVLLPTDGSESMERVLDHARRIAAADATVHVLNVVDDRAFLTLHEDLQADAVAELRGDGEIAVEEAATLIGEAGLRTATAVREGSPADEIIAYADEQDVDVIVMGTHGDDFRQNMVGSVSREVVARSSTPVLTVNVGERSARTDD
jgi:nucleotide-binding universal stress UspA family protein